MDVLAILVHITALDCTKIVKQGMFMAKAGDAFTFAICHSLEVDFHFLFLGRAILIELSQCLVRKELVDLGLDSGTYGRGRRRVVGDGGGMDSFGGVRQGSGCQGRGDMDSGWWGGTGVLEGFELSL